MQKNTLPHLLLAVSSALSACALEKVDSSATEYRQALPDAEALTLRGPEPESSRQHLQAASEQPSVSAASAARWYSFTREMRGNVNRVTREVLTQIALITHLEPTRVLEDRAEWGPHTDALSPVTYRFGVERVSPGEYIYRLEGRPKASTQDDDFLVVLEGRGFGASDARHGDGRFRFEGPNARALDPEASRDDAGSEFATLELVHELPADLRQGAAPYRISATLTRLDDSSLAITSVGTREGSGHLTLVAQADVDASHTTSLEDILVESQWSVTGAGRADITISGGDLPQDVAEVHAVECWGADFARVYYTDSVTFEPTEGDATACISRVN